VNESDVRARYNLPGCPRNARAGPGARQDGQQEVLAQLAMRHQQEYLLLINLVSKYVKDEETTPPELGATGQ
jgi:hypothetical protein